MFASTSASVLFGRTDKTRLPGNVFKRLTAILPRIATLQSENVINVQQEFVHDPKPFEQMPGPKKIPILGNSWRFAPLIGQYKLTELDKVMDLLYKEFGEVVKVSGVIGHPDLVFVFNADLVAQVFRREETLPHRPAMPSLHHYKKVLRNEFFGNTLGLIGVHGELWDNFRNQVQQIMLQPSTARKFVEPLNDIASDFMDRISDIRDENNELPGDFLNELYKWALESIGRVSLDTRLGCVRQKGSPPQSEKEAEETQRIIAAINTFFWTVPEVELGLPVWKFFATPAYKKYINALDDFRILCMTHISNAMEKMDTSNRNIKEGNDISIVERILKKSGNPKIATILALDLLLVGVDTTSVAATTTIYQLTQNPSKQEKLFEELKRVLPDENTPLTAKKLDQLPYLKACIKESLRLYPVILGNGRSLTSDAILGGYKVPKGTHVIFPHYVLSRLERYFSRPESFEPERWMKDNAGTGSKKIQEHAGCAHSFASLPFGYGRRTCIGKRFAETELLILLAKIFRKYNVDYRYGKLTYKVTPTYIPEQPLKFHLNTRV